MFVESIKSLSDSRQTSEKKKKEERNRSSSLSPAFGDKPKPPPRRVSPPRRVEDDTKSNYSMISKISKFTNNLMGKNNQINEQWYQFIYNNDQALDSDSNVDDKSMMSKFTLKSKLTAKSGLSQFDKMRAQQLKKARN